ncbi:MAG: hypothetical protein AAB546_01785 [Patescibacteria group bacterium]
MITDTKLRLLEYIETHGRARPHELTSYLGIGSVAVHRQLKALIDVGKISKTGKPPTVFYVLTDKKVNSGLIFEDGKTQQEIEKTYLYISPEGEMKFGFSGFAAWAVRVGMEKNISGLAMEYIKIRHEADKFINKDGLIDATEKMKNTFNNVWVDKTFYKDFYSLQKFGKTKLGQLVLYSKLAQRTELIQQIARMTKKEIDNLIARYDIEAVGFLPHSIPRKIQFLKVFSKALNIRLPEIKLVKAYAGSIPVAQKSLSKLEERIENASKTIEIKELQNRYNNILIIDDAVGSGATLNETAKKLKQANIAKNVYGFAIVGSMKGFEVIKEV